MQGENSQSQHHAQKMHKRIAYQLDDGINPRTKIYWVKCIAKASMNCRESPTSQVMRLGTYP